MSEVTGIVVATLGAGAGLILALRLRWLTRPGAAAALLVALALLLGEGVPGLLLLAAFFVTSSGLTRCGRGRRMSAPARADHPTHREPPEPSPPGPLDRDTDGRGPGQVLANGGVAALSSLLGLAGWGSWTHYAAAGALAAATADTWASEVGLWAGRGTRLLTTWEPVEPGRSGGVSWVGSGAGALGALLIGSLAWASTADPRMPIAMSLAGMGGMLADSWVGATWEGRVSWIGNDTVNWIGTGTGAVLGALLGS